MLHGMRYKLQLWTKCTRKGRSLMPLRSSYGHARLLV